MRLFKTKESEIDSFVKRLKEIGITAVIFDKRKIEELYTEKLSKRLDELFELLYDIGFDKFSITCEERKTEKSWYSADSGRVVLNLAILNSSNPAHKKTVQETAKKAQQIESMINKSNSG